MPTTDAFPPEVADLVEQVLATCRAQMTEGPVAATTYIVNTASKSLLPIEMYVPNDVAKEMSADVVRWVAKNALADATITVSEAWTLSQQDAKRYEEIRARYGSIGEYPGRLEILMVSVETYAGNWLGQAPIETKGKARRIGPMTIHAALAGDPTTGVAGRFSHFLPPREAGK